MKTASTTLKNAIRRDYNLNTQPRLTIEWNFNRYIPVSADNIPAEDSDGYDIEMFPIESIYSPNRPTRGVAKARINEARISAYSATPTDTRYYVASVSDQYKYWCSPVETNGSKVFPTHTDSKTKVRPHIKYTSLISANKIVINWENSFATPAQYYIYIQETVNGPWVALAGNSWTVNSKGQTVLYHQGNDVWSATRPVDSDGAIVANFKTLAGVMAHVNTMGPGQGAYPGTGANAFCNVIEISARREEDFTSRLITVSDQFDMGEKSIIYPMGTLTSNTATISLDNLDGVLSKESASAYLRYLVEPGATFNLEYVYTIGGVKHSVQQFKMVGGPWSGQRDDTVTIELTDDSKLLKELKPHACFYEGLPVTKIIWSLLDQVGYTNYAIQANDLVAHHIIPYFWADGEKTIWEIFDDLSKATQTAIYFDAHGVLQVKTREAGFNEAKTPDWVLRGTKSGLELPDIINLDQSDELEANHVTIDYQNTTVSDFNNGQPKLDKVWESDSTVALRSSQIARNISITEKYAFYISPKEAIYWPYSGIVQIEGEFIRYVAKNYAYYINGVRWGANIKSHAEKVALDAKGNTADRMKNGFTGGMLIGGSVEESDPGYPGRGLWNTYRATHVTNATGYDARVWFGGAVATPTLGFHYHDKINSSMVLQTSATRFKRWYDLLVVTRGGVFDAGYMYYGTKLKFHPGNKVNRAGMVIHSGANESGYYIELTPTNKLSAAARKTSQELLIYSRKNNVLKTLGTVAVTVAENQWYEIDIAFQTVNGTHILDVWIDGARKASVAVPAPWYNAPQGRFGMHARGNSKVSFEYLYALNHTTVTPSDNTGWYDRVNGGYQGGQWDREYIYSWKTGRRRIGKHWTKVKIAYGQAVMDEFGPIVHEVREMNVKFDPKPVLHSRLYMSNDWQAICPEYTSTPFGAKFILANTSRDNAVVHGEDNLSFVGSSVNQVLAIYGRVVTQADAAQVVAKNDSQIQRRGRVEIQISSPWIQTKAHADDLSKWIIKHWGEAADEQTVEIFGNPLLEIGDVVTIDYPDKNMTTSTHKYYVVGVNTSFEQGIDTTLTLRRVRG